MLTAVKTLWVRRNLALGIFLYTTILGALITAFIPIKFTATAIIEITPKPIEISRSNDLTSDAENLRNLIESQSPLLLSKENIQAAITQFDLIHRPELNPRIDTNRALALKIYDFINGYTDEQQSPPPSIEEILYRDIKQDTALNFTPSNTIEISYTSINPYLARAIVNFIAHNYVKSPDAAYTKSIEQESELPQSFSSPNIWRAISMICLLGLALGILGAIYIKPRQHKRM